MSPGLSRPLSDRCSVMRPVRASCAMPNGLTDCSKAYSLPGSPLSATVKPAGPTSTTLAPKMLVSSSISERWDP